MEIKGIPLPTNYTDAEWEGLKKYNKVDNADGTISFEDVTQYINKENSFFGANDANTMNGAINEIVTGDYLLPSGGTDGDVVYKENGKAIWNKALRTWYITCNYAIPAANYVDNPNGAWTEKVYADVPVTQSLSSMVPDINPDASVTTEDDYGLLKVADAMDGKVRCFFSEKPTGTYQIKSIQLTDVQAVTSSQSASERAEVYEFYKIKAEKEEQARQEALEIARQEAEKQAELDRIEFEKQEAERIKIENAKEERLMSIETKTNTLSDYSIAPMMMSLNDIPVELGEFTSNVPEFEVGKALKKNEPFVYKGIVGYAKQDITKGNVWTPYWNEKGEKVSSGTESIFAPRPKQNVDKSYPYMYGMKVDKDMIVVQNGVKYRCIKGVNEVLYDLADMQADFEVVDDKE